MLTRHFIRTLIVVAMWSAALAHGTAIAQAITRFDTNINPALSFEFAALVPESRLALRDFAQAMAEKKAANTLLAKSALAGSAASRATPLEPLVLHAPVDATRTLNLRFDAAQWLDVRQPALGYAVTGTVVGEARGTVVWVDYAGTVSAVVQLGDTQFQLLPATAHDTSQRNNSTETRYRWVEVDQRRFTDHSPDWAGAEALERLHSERKLLAQALDVANRLASVSAQSPSGLGATAAAILPNIAPQADGDTIIDVMVAYTAAARAAVGGTAAMASQINLAVAQTNLAYTTSGVKQQLRLVLAYEVAYAETGNMGTDLTVLRNVGGGPLDDVHLQRDAYGADVVSLWVEDGGGSCGIGNVMSTVAASFARSAFNVVARGCAVGNYSFAHELGHNMGLRHDPFVDTSTSPYPYAHGYVDTVNKFRTIMAYNDACVAKSISCVRVPQFSSATIPYRDWPSGDSTLSNAALALNNTRATLSAFRPNAMNAGGTIQFYPQTYSVPEGGMVTLKVSRLGGSTGGASVRFMTVDQTARAELDFLTNSGLLNWADGELGEKTVTIQTLQDTLNEGTENFRVILFDFVNAQALVGSAVGGSSATVEILDDEPDRFPANCVLPESGFSQPEGATAGWGIARDASTEGSCSLKSNPTANNGVAAKAQLQFEGVFVAGVISFDRRVSSEAEFDCLRFFVDGVVVGLNGSCTETGGVGASGNSGWARIEVPITAGNHTLLWSYEKDTNTVAGADAAWIDNLVLPMQTQTTPLRVLFNTAGGEVIAGVGGHVSARALNIKCGFSLSAQCNANAILGGGIKLVAMPNALSVVSRWFVNGVPVCTSGQPPLAPFNGSICAIDGLGLNGSTDITVQFAPRPLRSATIAVLTASKSPSAVGEAISLQISLAGTGPAGEVEVRRLSSSGVQIICAKVPLLSGRAACDVPLNARPVGLNVYQVYYAGDAANKEAQATIRHLVGTASNSLTLSMEPPAPLRGQTVTLTAQVLATADTAALTSGAPDKPIAATGNVSFVDSSGNTLCVAPALTPLTVSTASIAITSCTFVPQSSPTVAQSAIARYPAGAVSATTATATINYATVAKVAPNYTDMWWAGEAQSGWGMSITQHGNTQFNVLYSYNEAGQPVWLVMPGGTWNTEQTEYSGAVYQPQSSPYYAYKTAPDANAVLPLNVGKSIGQIKLTFLSAKTATLSYTINGLSGTKNIERQVFGAAATTTTQRLPVGDLWWGGLAENGWGLNIAQQGTTLFAVWYTYNTQGEATWYVMPGGTWDGNAYTGTLYNTQATAWLESPYNANFLRVNPVGSLRLEFYDANTALLQVQIAEQAFNQTRFIVRQGF